MHWLYLTAGGIVVAAVSMLAVVMITHFVRRHKRGGLSPDDYWLVNEFSRCNVIVFGKKGTGKDLLFAHVIALRGDRHYSNIEYNADTQVIRLTDVSLGANTFEDCIQNTIEKLDPQFEEGKDIYISDGGIYLSSQYDSALNKLYPSMPIFYALSRHLYNNNIHVNVQNLGRLWLKLREQADSFIRVLGTTDRGSYLLVRAISYDNITAASNGLLPARDRQYRATHGEITERRFRVYKSELNYDTRYFKDVFLNVRRTPLEEILHHVRRQKR